MKIGRAYKIIYIGNENINITYIGSTFNTLRDRFKAHKENYNTDLKNKKFTVSLYTYFEKYNIKNFKIFLIKEYEVIDRKHLQMYEQLWMNKIKNINKYKAFQPLIKEHKKQYNEINKEHFKEQKKQYYEDNKENFKEQKKQYYKDNKEDILNKKKQYYEDNKEDILSKRKEYEKNNKDNYTKIINCGCGSSIQYGKLARHNKSKKHLKFLESQ